MPFMPRISSSFTTFTLTTPSSDRSKISVNKRSFFTGSGVVSALASGLVYLATLVDATKGLSLRAFYALFAPIGSFIVVTGFLAGILQAKSKSAISWRGRTYSMKEQSQSSINV